LNLVDLIVALVLMVGLLENREPLIPIAALGLVLMRSLASRITKGIGFRRIEWVVALAVVYWIANYFWSTRDVNNLVSFEFLRRDGALLVTYPVFMLMLGWATKPRYVEAFWLTFVFVLGVVAVIAFVTTLNFPYLDFLGRLGVLGFDRTVGANMFFGWYEAHNTAGAVYALASIMALTFLQEEKAKTRRKTFLWALLLACILGLAFTFSRGAYLAFLVGAAFVIPIHKFGTVIKAGLLVAVPTVVLVLMTSSVLDRIDTITDPYYGTNAARLNIWGEAWDDFRWSPTIGIGFGRFNDEAVSFSGVKYFAWVGTRGRIVNSDSHAHNSYLHFLAEGGIIGLFLMLFIWRCAWEELSLYQRRFRQSPLPALCKISKACIVVVFVSAFTEHMLGRGSVLLVLMSLVALTLASSRAESAMMERRQTEQHEESSNARATQMAPQPVG
jgi:O-antigen ligase